MPLKFPRHVLEQMVLEELVKYLPKLMSEAPPGRGTVLDDEPEDELPPDDEVPNPGRAPEEDLPSTSPAPEAGDEPGEPNDQPGEDDAAQADLDALDAGEEPPSEEEEGTVAGELVGKTIEDITVDDDSQIMPGSTEIVFTFRENPDALRLLLTKTGQVKYFYRGLHNNLDAPISPMPADDAPEEELPGDEGGEELEDMSPLGDEDMSPPEEEPAEEPPLEEPTSSRR